MSAAAPADLLAYDDVMHRWTIPSGHGQELSTALSQESSTTTVIQSRSAHGVDVPQGYDDVMERRKPVVLL